MLNTSHWKYVALCGLTSWVQCSSHVCNVNANLCTQPTDASLSNKQQLSLKSDTKVEFSVNDIGLNEAWHAKLEQSADGMAMACPAADSMPCSAMPTGSSRCIDLDVTCPPGQATTCTVNILKSTLTKKGFVAGTTCLVVTQPPRPVGHVPSLDIQDPNFDFGDWTPVPLPVIIDGTSVASLDSLQNVAIINQKIYLSRYYNNSAGFCSDIIFETADKLKSAEPIVIKCDSNIKYRHQYALSNSQILASFQTVTLSDVHYSINQYDTSGIRQFGPTPITFEAAYMTAMDSFAASPDSKTLFVAGATGAVYISPLSPLTTPFDKLSAISGSGPLLMPLSAMSVLAVSPGEAVHRYDLSTMSWSDSKLSDEISPINVVAIGAGDLTGDGFPELLIANDKKIVFYKNTGANSFSGVPGGLSLPPIAEPIRGIALGELDGQNGLDLAVVTTKSLYIAMHR